MKKAECETARQCTSQIFLNDPADIVRETFNYFTIGVIFESISNSGSLKPLLTACALN